MNYLESQVGNLAQICSQLLVEFLAHTTSKPTLFSAKKVPIEAFHNQWRLTGTPIPGSLDALKAELQSKAESLCNLPENALRRAYNELIKVQSGGYELVPVGAPGTKINTRGRPAGSKKVRSQSRSTRRDPSAFEYVAPPKSNAPSKSKAIQKCSKCKKPGHNIKKCPLVRHPHIPTSEELQLDQDKNISSNSLEHNQEDDSDLEISQTHETLPEELDPDSDVEEDNDHAPLLPFLQRPAAFKPFGKTAKPHQMLLKRPHSVKTPRPGNPHAVSLPVSFFQVFCFLALHIANAIFVLIDQMAETIGICGLHYTEAEHVPIGVKNGWPTWIDFDKLPRYVTTVIRLVQITLK